MKRAFHEVLKREVSTVLLVFWMEGDYLRGAAARYEPKPKQGLGRPEFTLGLVTARNRRTGAIVVMYKLNSSALVV
jgi:hypothetical protein